VRHLQELEGSLVLAHVREQHPHRVHLLHDDAAVSRFVRGRDRLLRALEKLGCGEGLSRGPRVGEEGLEEPEVRLGPQRLALGHGPLPPGLEQLMDRDRAGGGQRERHGAARGHCRPVPPDELAGAVGDGVGPRLDGNLAEVALEILDQDGHRGVALPRILLQRLGDDGVEVAAEQAPQLLRGGRSPSSVLDQRLPRKGPRRGDHLRRAHRSGVGHRLDQLGRRTGLAPSGELSREEQVEDHSQCIDVGGRSHGCAEHLLRCGELGGQGAAPFARELGGKGRNGLVLEQLRDSEVEQLDLAVRCHQHVRGL